MLQIQVINFSISLIVALMAVLMGLYAWRQRHSQSTMWFAALLFAFAWVGWWNAFEAVVGTDLNAFVSLSKLEYVGGVFIPILWLHFALRTSGYERPLSRPIQLGLLMIPFATILLAMTNEYHGFVWAQPHFTIMANAPVYEPVYGLWFWVYLTYSYTVFMIGTIILGRYALTTYRVYRVQALLVMAGTAVPWVGNLLTIFDSLNPFPYIYMNMVMVGFCVLFLSFGLLKLKLFDVSPLAYETILNNIPAGILVVDLRNRILAVNDNIKSLLRLDAADLVGQQMEYSLPHCAPELARIQKSEERKGRFAVNDHVYEVSVSVAYTRDGQERGSLFVFSDITAEVAAEKARQSELEFSELINQLGATLNTSLDVKMIAASILDSLDRLIPNCRLNIMLIDDDGCSTRVYQQRGYPNEVALIQHDFVFDYHISPILVESVVSPAMHSTPSVRTDYDGIISTTDGPENSFATIAMMAEGKPIGFINIDCNQPEVFTPELSNRMQIFGQQAALAIKNAQLYEQTRYQTEELKSRVSSLMITQQVYKDIGFSIDIDTLLQLILDAGLRISRADVGYVALMKDGALELAKIYGNYDTSLLDHILSAQGGIIRQSLSEGRVLAMQSPNPLESAFRDVQAQIALPLFTANSEGVENIYGLVVLETKKPSRFTEDRLQLLDLIRDRAALALQNVELVNRVRERANELEILYGKVSYLEKFKTDMIRIAAHDLKNPLGVIINYLTMLIESPELELDLDKVYPSMLRSAERMLQIVQNFLSMDRIEKAAKLQTMEPFDLVEVVITATEEFMPRVEQKAQYMDVMLPHEPCIVRGDSAQIYEAISNFIGNAIKYTPEGGHIRVLLEALGDTVQLEITDNGFGIPEENQAKLFQPFYRAKTHETSNIEGTGLGLHLTKTIIEQQDGEIIFNSVYHQGSTFGFKMPLYALEMVTEPEKIAG